MADIVDISGFTVINDLNYQSFIPDVAQQSEHGMGLIPRNFVQMPLGALPYAAEYDMPLISEDEIEDRIRTHEKDESSLYHLRQYHKIQ